MCSLQFILAIVNIGVISRWGDGVSTLDLRVEGVLFFIAKSNKCRRIQNITSIFLKINAEPI